jgi:hypothetical protein
MLLFMVLIHRRKRTIKNGGSQGCCCLFGELFAPIFFTENTCLNESKLHFSARHPPTRFCTAADRCWQHYCCADVAALTRHYMHAVPCRFKCCFTYHHRSDWLRRLTRCMQEGATVLHMLEQRAQHRTSTQQQVTL